MSISPCSIRRKADGSLSIRLAVRMQLNYLKPMLFWTQAGRNFKNRKKKGSQEFTVTPLCIKLQYSYFFTFPKNITLLTMLFLHTDWENEKKKKTTYIFGLPHHMALLTSTHVLVNDA